MTNRIPKKFDFGTARDAEIVNGVDDVEVSACAKTTPWGANISPRPLRGVDATAPRRRRDFSVDATARRRRDRSDDAPAPRRRRDAPILRAAGDPGSSARRSGSSRRRRRR